jgi:eukaryotic-like serine/threonine-protein kinase
MELVNSAGHVGNGMFALTSSPEEKADKPFRWEFVYGAQGQVAYELALNRQGQRINTTVYGPFEAGSTRNRTAYEIGRKGSLSPEKSSCAAYVSYDYSPEGYVTQTHYYDQSGNPTSGKEGAFIKQKKYDELGREIESASLWKDGRPMNDMDGNAATRYSYDESSNVVSIERIDAAGDPTELNKDHVNRTTMKYDERGNLIGVSLQHANGDTGLFFGLCKALIFSLDERGNSVEAYCARRDGQLSKTEWAVTTHKFDDDDQMVESTFFDADAHPVLGPAGAFREKVSYDPDGNVTELAEYGTDDRPVIIKMGFHKKISEFKNGHEIRTEYRDVDGRLTALDEGFAAVSREYDTQGNETVTTYLGVDDRPVSNRTEGYAVKTVSYDACGRATETKFLDADHHPVRSKKRYADIRQTYDENNNVKEEAYFDDENRPARSIDGYARVVREFDRNRNIIDARYFDQADKPLLVKEAYAERKSQYDSHNDLVEEEYLGSSGEPVANDRGWARHTRRYDEHNALIEEAWFGPNREPALNEQGWARITNVNDVHGRDLETAWFGIDGKPLVLNKGYAKRTRRYDDNGQVVEEAYFGTEGEPVASQDGYARFVKTYDAFEHLTGGSFRGPRRKSDRNKRRISPRQGSAGRKK